MGGDAEGLLFGCIIGDALGRSLEGMSRGHCQAHFRAFDGYFDAAPALKGKMERWVKPGLYGSIAQFMLMAGLARRGPQFDPALFKDLCAGAPAVSGSPTGIFRSPGRAELLFLEGLNRSTANPIAADTITARLAPMGVSLCLTETGSHRHLMEILAFGCLFSSSPVSLAGLLLAVRIGQHLLANGPLSPSEVPQCARDALRDLRTEVSRHTSLIFDMTINPDSLLTELAYYEPLLSLLRPDMTAPACEQELVKLYNRHRHSPVTRATIDDPRLIIPFAVCLIAHDSVPHEFLHRTAIEGGAAAPLTALSGALWGAVHGCESLPAPLVRDLVNRTRIADLIASLAARRIPAGLATQFTAAEAGLTLKEIEELNARTRHTRTKQPKAVSPRQREKELSRHIVESWTKVDKARWKKEQRKDRKSDDSSH